MPVLSSQGATVTFNGQGLGKVVGVNGSFSTGAKEIRQLADNLDVGTQQYLSILEKTLCEQSIDLEVIATSFNTNIIGTKAPLAVTGSQWSLSFGMAFCADIKVTAKVADVLRMTYQFKRTYS